MRFFKRWPVRIVIFIVIFFFINAIIEFLFLRFNGPPMITMMDLNRVGRTDIVFIGSSLSRGHIDNSIIEQELNISSFNLSASSAKMPANYAFAKEAIKKVDPDYIVLIYDPIVEYNPNEPIMVESGLWSFLDLDTKIEYAYRNIKIDGYYLDRIFPWRATYPSSIKDFWSNLSGKINMDEFYQIKLKGYSKNYIYDGKGFYAPYFDKDLKSLNGVRNQKVKLKENIDIRELEKTLEEIHQMCKKNDCQLVVITTPQFPQALLGDETYIHSYKTADELCDKYGIPFFNFAYSRPCILPDMSGYFYKREHFDGDGAKVFSVAVAQVLEKYLSGQDISDYFYTQEEYAASMDYILNGWYTESKKNGKVTYTADSIYGSNVNPEYQFVMIDEDGKSNIVQEYSGKNKYICEENIMNKKEIQVYIRNETNLDQPPVLAVKK